jgi:transketolase
VPDSDSELLAINTVRTLAMDAVQAAESGHPGTPMALAPLAYALFLRHMKHNPADPAWPDRDRFVLSAGHASMLLYAALYLSGYDLSLDEIRRFRQWGSRTPGHPEVGHTPGVETTTGPLGQGIANAVGMAVAERHLAATFNRDGHTVVDHLTWFIAGDGDLMEGISHEAASFAGHQRLGKLIGFFDDNRITIDGSTSLSCSDDVAARFGAYGWHVARVADVNDLDAIDAAVAEARTRTDQPSLVIVRSHIGYGSPNRVDTAKAHGEPLGSDEVALARQALGWPFTEPFHVPEKALIRWRAVRERGAAAQESWRRMLIDYARAHPDEAKEFGRRIHGDLPAGWESALPVFDQATGNVASRAASGIVLNAIASRVPELVGGSADLSGSNLTTVKGAPAFSPATPAGRNFFFGIREHAMGGVMNGMALHGGLIPYGGTFLVFADYMRPAIRLAALMRRQVIYVFTHDSIGLGEDGPTHQPVEHLAALRCIPGLLVLRPADAAETAEAWRLAVRNRSGPTALVLTRQKLALITRGPDVPVANVARGAYVLQSVPSARVVLLSSGSEVQVALDAAALLEKSGVAARVVSVPSHELFLRQDPAYRDSVLPAGLPRVAVEAAHPMSWYRLVGDRGTVIGIDRFGASAPYQRLYEEYGITPGAVAEAARKLLS